MTFFAGVGGFTKGMTQAGYKPVGWCEIDKFARKSYIAIHEPGDEWNATDIRFVQPGDLPEADCYCFGFPCQAFSIAGQRRGFEDTRGTLFFEIMRLARERKPKYLFAENVAGLLNHEGGRTFATILDSFRELDYDVQGQILNSKDFGVPQNRERIFLVANLRGEPRPEVFPIFETDGEATKADYEHNNHVIEPGGVYTDCSEDFMRKPLIGLSRCLKSSKSDAGIIDSQFRIRKFTPLECWRLQGWDDEDFYKAKAVNSDSQLYKQAGNGVTVNVIRAIANRLPKAA